MTRTEEEWLAWGFVDEVVWQESEIGDTCEVYIWMNKQPAGYEANFMWTYSHKPELHAMLNECEGLICSDLPELESPQVGDRGSDDGYTMADLVCVAVMMMDQGQGKGADRRGVTAATCMCSITVSKVATCKQKVLGTVGCKRAKSIQKLNRLRLRPAKVAEMAPNILDKGICKFGREVEVNLEYVLFWVGSKGQGGHERGALGAVLDAASGAPPECQNTLRQASVWLRDLTEDGDVENHPGPGEEVRDGEERLFLGIVAINANRIHPPVVRDGWGRVTTSWGTEGHLRDLLEDHKRHKWAIAGLSELGALDTEIKALREKLRDNQSKENRKAPKQDQKRKKRKEPQEKRKAQQATKRGSEPAKDTQPGKEGS